MKTTFCLLCLIVVSFSQFSHDDTEMFTPEHLPYKPPQYHPFTEFDKDPFGLTAESYAGDLQQYTRMRNSRTRKDLPSHTIVEKDIIGVHPVSGNIVKQKYRSRIIDGTLSLDTEHSVTEVTCRHDKVTVKIKNSGDYKLWIPGTRMIIGKKWSTCIEQNMTAVFRMMHSRQVISETDTHVVMEYDTTVLKPFDLILDAKMSVEIVYNEQEELVPNTRKRFFSIGGRLSNSQIWGYNYDAENDTSIRDIPLISWKSNDTESWLQKEVNITCYSCYAVLRPTITVEFEIDWYGFKKLSIITNGRLVVSVGIDFQFKFKGTWEKEVEIFSRTLGTLTFTIGPIPISITPTVGLKASILVEVEGLLHMKALARLTDSCSLGFLYDRRDGNIRPIFTHAGYNMEFLPPTVQDDSYASLVSTFKLIPFTTIMLWDTFPFYFDIQPTLKVSAHVGATAERCPLGVQWNTEWALFYAYQVQAAQLSGILEVLVGSSELTFGGVLPSPKEIVPKTFIDYEPLRCKYCSGCFTVIDALSLLNNLYSAVTGLVRNRNNQQELGAVSAESTVQVSFSYPFGCNRVEFVRYDNSTGQSTIINCSPTPTPSLTSTTKVPTTMALTTTKTPTTTTRTPTTSAPNTATPTPRVSTTALPSSTSPPTTPSTTSCPTSLTATCSVSMQPWRHSIQAKVYNAGGALVASSGYIGVTNCLQGTCSGFSNNFGYSLELLNDIPSLQLRSGYNITQVHAVQNMNCNYYKVARVVEFSFESIEIHVTMKRFGNGDNTPLLVPYTTGPLRALNPDDSATLAVQKGQTMQLVVPTSNNALFAVCSRSTNPSTYQIQMVREVGTWRMDTILPETKVANATYVEIDFRPLQEVMYDYWAVGFIGKDVEVSVYVMPDELDYTNLSPLSGSDNYMEAAITRVGSRNTTAQNHVRATIWAYNDTTVQGYVTGFNTMSIYDRQLVQVDNQLIQVIVPNTIDATSLKTITVTVEKAIPSAMTAICWYSGNLLITLAQLTTPTCIYNTDTVTSFDVSVPASSIKNRYFMLVGSNIKLVKTSYATNINSGDSLTIPFVNKQALIKLANFTSYETLVFQVRARNSTAFVSCGEIGSVSSRTSVTQVYVANNATISFEVDRTVLQSYYDKECYLSVSVSVPNVTSLQVTYNGVIDWVALEMNIPVASQQATFIRASFGLVAYMTNGYQAGVAISTLNHNTSLSVDVGRFSSNQFNAIEKRLYDTTPERTILQATILAQYYSAESFVLRFFSSETLNVMLNVATLPAAGVNITTVFINGIDAKYAIQLEISRTEYSWNQALGTRAENTTSITMLRNLRLLNEDLSMSNWTFTQQLIANKLDEVKNGTSYTSRIFATQQGFKTQTLFIRIPNSVPVTLNQRFTLLGLQAEYFSTFDKQLYIVQQPVLPTTTASPTPTPTSTAKPTTSAAVPITTTAAPVTTVAPTTTLAPTTATPTPTTVAPTTATTKAPTTVAPTTTPAPTTTVAPTTSAPTTTTVPTNTTTDTPTTTAAPTTTVAPTTTSSPTTTATQQITTTTLAPTSTLMSTMVTSTTPSHSSVTPTATTDVTSTTTTVPVTNSDSSTTLAPTQAAPTTSAPTSTRATIIPSVPISTSGSTLVSIATTVSIRVIGNATKIPTPSTAGSMMVFSTDGASTAIIVTPAKTEVSTGIGIQQAVLSFSVTQLSTSAQLLVTLFDTTGKELASKTVTVSAVGEFKADVTSLISTIKRSLSEIRQVVVNGQQLSFSVTAVTANAAVAISPIVSMSLQLAPSSGVTAPVPAPTTDWIYVVMIAAPSAGGAAIIVAVLAVCLVITGIIIYRCKRKRTAKNVSDDNSDYML